MDLNKKTYLLITGASRGIGRTMAIECSKKIAPGSLVVLLARSESGLNKTKDQISSNSKPIIVRTIPIDLSNAQKSELQKAILTSLEGYNAKDFERALIIHNAGSLGDSTKLAKELDDMDYWVDYYKLNVFSVTVLNAVFMKEFQDIEKVVVNITSLCGIQPFPSLSYYCSGKASREMYFKVLASEEPNVVVLNYSPGPVDTEMFHEIQTNSHDENLRSSFTEQLEKRTVLTTEQTTAKFLSVLEANKFKSGDHVDYFD